MANNEIGLKLNGVVPLDLYSKVLVDFASLIHSLSDEVAGNNAVEWTVSELRTGSAFIGIKGYSQHQEDVEKVVVATRIVTESLSAGRLIPYSEYVEAAAVSITSVINGKIKSIQFFTGETDSVILDRPIIVQTESLHQKRDFGTITGIVSSISERPDIKLSLYDDMSDRRVVCYLTNAQAENARDSWRKRVSVTGFIRRDPDNGRAIDIREIAKIEFVDSAENGFLNARGMGQNLKDRERAEDIIRRLRDGI